MMMLCRAGANFCPELKLVLKKKIKIKGCNYDKKQSARPYVKNVTNCQTFKVIVNKAFCAFCLSS